MNKEGFIAYCKQFLYNFTVLFIGTNNTFVTEPFIAQTPASGIPADIQIGMTSAYAVIFTFALLGNSLGLCAILKKTSSTNITNVFIANMAVADLLLTLTVMPYTVAYLYRGDVWIGGIMGEITCRAIFYAIPVSIAATVLTMMVISLDRFYAIYYPLRENIFQKPIILSSIIWSLSLVLMLPYALLFQVKFDPGLNAYVCLQVWPWADPSDITYAETYRVLRFFHISNFILMYVLPLLSTITIYILICRKLTRRQIPGNVTQGLRAMADNSKRKVVRLLVIICVVFAVCWFPTYVNHYFTYVLQPGQGPKLPFSVQLVFTWIAHLNSAINPFLYILLNKKFRVALFSVLPVPPCLSSWPIGTSAVTAQTALGNNPGRGWVQGQEGNKELELTPKDNNSNCIQSS